jgi:fumarate reductase iron-sulfur subunit
MNLSRISATVFRFNPETDSSPGFTVYDVPFTPGMSAMTVLDYIYMNMDATLAYYDHAGCALGICGRCAARINGKPGLLCQTPVVDDVKIEPLSVKNVIRDLVVKRKGNKKNE